MQQNRRFAIDSAWPIVALLVIVTSGLDARAQTLSGELVRAHWPDVLYETQAGAWHRPGTAAAENFSDTDLLSFVDTLRLSWDAGIRDGGPVIDFGLSWDAGQGGILDGQIVRQMPDSIALSLIDLHARVLLNGDYAGDLVLALDSLWLPEGDFRYDFSTASVDWNSLFDGMDEERTREAFASGFVLDRLEILRVQFDEPAPEEQVVKEVLVVRRPPRRRAIFVPDVGVWVGWYPGRDPYRGSPRIRSGKRKPRGRTIGRGTSSPGGRTTRGGRTDGPAAGATDGSVGTGSATDSGAASGSTTDSGAASGTDSGRSADSGRTGADHDKPSTAATRERGRIPFLGKKGDKDDDDDDDDRDFLGPAVGAAAAIGALAYFGGTVGYFGYAEDAPIGLEAGRVTARGGILAHAAINSDVFLARDNEQLVVGLSGVFPSLISGLHPMVGLDVWFLELGDSYDATPTLTAGGLYRSGKVSFHFGVDLARGRPQMGLAISFRD
jgi:hypothetical protein